MRQHKISVLIAQDSASLSSAFPFATGADTRNTFNVDTWSRGGLRFFVIGDAEKPEIQRLAQALQSANP